MHTPPSTQNWCMHILFSSGAQIDFKPFSKWLFLPCIYTVYDPRHPPKQMEFEGDLPHVYPHSAQLTLITAKPHLQSFCFLNFLIPNNLPLLCSLPANDA